MIFVKIGERINVVANPTAVYVVLRIDLSQDNIYNWDNDICFGGYE